MDSYTIELIKQVGAVGFIAILLIRQNGKSFSRLLSMTELNYSKLFDKLDDLVHKVDHTYLSCEEVEDIFTEVSENHKLRKLKVLIHSWENIKKTSVDISDVKEIILADFKAISSAEALKFNKIKSHKFDKDLGVKFLAEIPWDNYIKKTMVILKGSESITDLENRFFALSDQFLIAIRTKLQI